MGNGYVLGTQAVKGVVSGDLHAFGQPGSGEAWFAMPVFVVDF